MKGRPRWGLPTMLLDLANWLEWWCYIQACGDVLEVLIEAMQAGKWKASQKELKQLVLPSTTEEIMRLLHDDVVYQGMNITTRLKSLEVDQDIFEYCRDCHRWNTMMAMIRDDAGCRWGTHVLTVVKSSEAGVDTQGSNEDLDPVTDSSSSSCEEESQGDLQSVKERSFCGENTQICLSYLSRQSKLSNVVSKGTVVFVASVYDLSSCEMNPYTDCGASVVVQRHNKTILSDNCDGFFSRVHYGQKLVHCQDHLIPVLNRAKALPEEDFEDLQSADIINLVEAPEQELSNSNVLQLTDWSPNDPGLEEEDEEHVEPSPTLSMPNLAKILTLHQQLIDLIYEADPSFEREETLTSNLTRDIVPYKEIYWEHLATIKQPMIMTFFQSFSASPTSVLLPATQQQKEQQEPTPGPSGVTHAHASTPTVSDSDSDPDSPPSPPSPTPNEADTHTYNDDNDAPSMDVDVDSSLNDELDLFIVRQLDHNSQIYLHPLCPPTSADCRCWKPAS
ncbi:putative Tigger transposable element-derived protein 1-like 321, partial [Homarus americanus]